MSTYAQISRLLGRRGGKGEPLAPRVPEINLLPRELAEQRLTSQQRRLLLLGLLLLVGAVLQFRLVGEKAVGSFRSLVPASFEGEASVTAEVAALKKKVEALRTGVGEGEGAKAALDQQRVPWGDLLRYVYGHAPEGMSVGSVRQNGLEATLTGSGPTAESIADYRTALLNSPAVQTVALSSRSRDPSSGGYAFAFQITIIPGVAVENP
ncbi:MAG: PilN domain-containing protein [Chloroflexi bacterium]|nr:PilN domain-containing protein [Chloroflexota bacterium]